MKEKEAGLIDGSLLMKVFQATVLLVIFLSPVMMVFALKGIGSAFAALLVMVVIFMALFETYIPVKQDKK